MSGTLDEGEERQLRMELMRADLDLKRKQAFWESPKGLAAIVGATALVFGTIAGLLGYQIGRAPPAPQQVIILEQPAPAKAAR